MDLKGAYFVGLSVVMRETIKLRRTLETMNLVLLKHRQYQIPFISRPNSAPLY